jgi:hypothetical protein
MQESQEIQIVLNSIAREVLRNQADQDYIAARACYKMQLRQQFMWSAQQAIEKYLKAILLFNGKSARYYQKDESTIFEMGHNLILLNEKVCTILAPHYEISESERELLSHLYQQGASNRYISFLAHNSGDELMRLDALVWNIRRYCQHISGKALGEPTQIPGLKEATYKYLTAEKTVDHPHKFKLTGGVLEKILKRESKNPARMSLVWANRFYGAKKRHSVTYRAFSSAQLPPNLQERLNPSLEVLGNYISLTQDPKTNLPKRKPLKNFPEGI